MQITGELPILESSSKLVFSTGLQEVPVLPLNIVAILTYLEIQSSFGSPAGFSVARDRRLKSCSRVYFIVVILLLNYLNGTR